MFSCFCYKVERHACQRQIPRQSRHGRTHDSCWALRPTPVLRDISCRIDRLPQLTRSTMRFYNILYKKLFDRRGIIRILYLRLEPRQASFNCHSVACSHMLIQSWNKLVTYFPMQRLGILCIGFIFGG